MSRKLASRLNSLLSIFVIFSLLFSPGLALAQSGGTETPTETPPPAETAVPTETAAPTEEPATPVPTETAPPAAETSAAPEEGRGDPLLSDVLNRLVKSYQDGGVAAAAQFAEANGLALSMQNNGESVQVSAVLAPGKTVNDARDIVATFSGLVEAEAGNNVQISIPIQHLSALAASGVFAGVRLPAYAEELAGTYNSEGVSTSGASIWHNVGLTGRGVKVAILDGGFNGYAALLGTELPPAAMVHTRSFRADGSIIGNPSFPTNHGTQVAQIVYDMAPGVEMWLVNIATDVEFAEAMDWLIGQGVQVINASIGWTNYTPGDGTGLLQDSVTHVTNAGILYVASAGNSAQRHYQDEFRNSGGYHDWDPGAGVTIYNQLTTNPGPLPPGWCWYLGNLAWNDWGDTAPGVDFKLEAYEFISGSWVNATPSWADNSQAQGYPWPTDSAYYCPTGNFPVGIAIKNVSGGVSGGPNPSYFEWYGNSDFQFMSSASTILAPADSPNAFTVGAYNWLNGSLQAYSSRGPVNGAGGNKPNGSEAIKPDITGPDCTTTSMADGSTGYPNGFCGTSGAAPHVAGAAALVLQAFPSYSPNDIRTFLEGRAVDQGAAGKDNLWGAGKLNLGAVPPGPAACSSGTATCVADMSTSWPLFQNFPQRTGNGAGTPVDPNASLMWTTPLGADVRSVVIGPPNPVWGRGLIFSKAGRYVYGTDPDRGPGGGGGAWTWSQAPGSPDGENIQWKFDLGVAGAAKGPGAPAVTDYNDNGTPGDTGDDSMFVYVGSGDGYVYKLDGIDGDWLPYDTNDSSTWGAQAVCKSAKLGADLSKASPVIGMDGTIYFVDDTAAVDRLIAVNPDCSQKWAINLGAGAGTSSPAYWANPATGDTNDDLIFIGADKLYAVTIWGGIKWSASLKTGAEVATVPTTPVVIDPGGAWAAYAVNSLGDLYSVDPATGVPTRAYDAPAGAHASGSLAAFDNGAHFFLYWGHLAALYRHDTGAAVPNGTSLPLGGSLTDASPVIDTNNNAFVGSADGKVYGVDGDTMTALAGWPKVAGVSTAVGLAISPNDGWLYVPSSDDNLRAYGALPGGCVDCVAEAGSDWPMFQRNQANTGAGGFTVGANPSLLWQRAPGGDVFPPVVGEYNWDWDTGAPGVEFPQGISYFVTGRYLRALDLATRSVLWSYDLGVAGTPVGFSAPAVANQGTPYGFGEGIVYVGGKDGVLHAVNARWGYDQWKIDVGGDISKASPVIGDDGTVYVVEDAAIDRLIAVSHAGSVRWAQNIGAATGASSPAYNSASDCIFVGGDKLYGFSQSGAPCGTWAAGGYALGAATVPGAPLIAGGNVYALNSLGDLYRAPVGGGGATLVSDAPAGAGSGSLAFDAGGCTGGCIYWTLGGKLYRWNTGGAIPHAPDAAITLSGTTANSTPVIDSAGNVFAGASDNKLYSVTRAGLTATLIFTAAGSMANAGAVTHSPFGGVLLWPSADDNLYAFGTPEGLCATCSLADTQWPMFQRTGNHHPGFFGAGGQSARESRLYNTGPGPVRPPVADDSSNRIYIVAGQYLLARDRGSDSPVWWNGSVEKKYNLGVAVTAGAYGSPALGKDTSRQAGDQFIILVGGADGVLHAVTASNGDLLWKVDVGNNISKASPAVSDQGYILVVEDNAAPASDRLIAVDFKGTVVWSKLIGNSDGTSSPAIDNMNTAGDPSDDVVLVGGGLGLYAFKLADGTMPAGWTAAYANIGVTNGAPMIRYIGAGFEAYYVVTKDAELVRVINNTNYQVLVDVPGVGKSAAPFAIGYCNDNSDPCTAGFNIRILFGVGNTLYQYFHADPNNDGLLRSVVLGGDLGDSSPLVGDGHVYIGSSDNKLYVVNADGWLTNVAWVSAPSGGSMAGAGAFIQPWTFAWPSQDGKLHIYEYAGGDSASPDTAANGQWPLFQNTNQHQGAAASTLPASPVEQWAVLGAGDVRSPVIGEINQPWNNGAHPDGVAFYVAGRYLYALDVRTHLIAKQWDLGATSGVSGYSSPAVIRLDPQNTPGDPSDDELRVFVGDKNGVVRQAGAWYCPAVYCGTAQWGWWDGAWSMADVGGDASRASPLAGRNHFVYVLEDAPVDRLHAINLWTGSIGWTTALGAGSGSSSPAYYDSPSGPDRVLVGADKLYAVNANTGGVIWSRNVGGPITSAPLVIGADVYVLTSAAKLYKIPVTGGTVTPVPLVSSIVGTVGSASMARYDAAGADDYLFFAVGNKLYRYNLNGGVLSAPLTLGVLATNFTNSTPLVDNAGNVFIGGADGYLYGVNGATMAVLTPAYDPITGLGWPKKIGAGTAASSAAGALAMDANGYLYVPSADDNLRRFGPAAPTACADCRLYTEGQWPMFQHDAGHTGKNATGAGHRTPVVKWTRTNGAPFTPPRTAVLSAPTTNNPSGMLYYTSGQHVFMRSALGGLRGSFDLGVAGNPSGGASPALLLRDDNNTTGCPATPSQCDDDTVWVIVGAKDGFLYALDANQTQTDFADMTMVWRIDLGGDISKSSPLVGPDGTIYVVEDATPNDILHAVYWNGTRRWSRTLGAGTGASSPVLDAVNNRIFVGSANKVYAFDRTTGAPIAGWETGLVIGVTGTVNTTPVIFNGNLWILNSLADLYRLNPALGAQIPQLAYGDAVGAVGDGVAPALQADPYLGYDIVVFTAGNRVYRILWNNAGGGSWVNWQWRATAGTVGAMSPVIDANGWAYVLDSMGYLNAYYRYGPWWAPVVFSKKVATQGTMTGGIIVGNDGKLYVPSRNGTFYGLDRP
jgi:outer membrane protein assembly factor BamB